MLICSRSFWKVEISKEHASKKIRKDLVFPLRYTTPGHLGSSVEVERLSHRALSTPNAT